uniref:Uncharacterized protein n=1 Tax=Tetraodon nigroviridis TaxID=99883 RepID=H3CKY9_TETNG
MLALASSSKVYRNSLVAFSVDTKRLLKLKEDKEDCYKQVIDAFIQKERRVEGGNVLLVPRMSARHSRHLPARVSAAFFWASAAGVENLLGWRTSWGGEPPGVENPPGGGVTSWGGEPPGGRVRNPAGPAPGPASALLCCPLLVGGGAARATPVSWVKEKTKAVTRTRTHTHTHAHTHTHTHRLVLLGDLIALLGQYSLPTVG